MGEIGKHKLREMAALHMKKKSEQVDKNEINYHAVQLVSNLAVH